MNMQHVIKVGPVVCTIERQNTPRDWELSFCGVPARLILDSPKYGRVITRGRKGRMEAIRAKLG